MSKKIGDELEKLIYVDMLTSKMLQQHTDMDNTTREKSISLFTFVKEYYVYNLKLLINQFDLEPVSKANNTVYFLFDDQYLALSCENFANCSIDIKIDHILLIRNERQEQVDEIRDVMKRLSFEEILISLYRDIDFNFISKYMIKNVAGNKDTVNTIKDLNVRANRMKDEILSRIER